MFDRDDFLQKMCDSANEARHNAIARAEREYGYVDGLDFMLHQVVNYFHEEGVVLQEPTNNIANVVGEPVIEPVILDESADEPLVVEEPIEDEVQVE